MSFWVILGGAAIGVGAIAAAPFTGGGSVLVGASAIASLAGAGTIAAAAGAGIAGAVVGSVISDSDKDSGERIGKEKATAKYGKKEEELIAEFKRAVEQLKDDKEYFDLIIALFAIGMATASADGNISKIEIDDLDAFVTGVGSSNLPDKVKIQIDKLRKNPPNFKTAMTFVNKLNNFKARKKLFENVIIVISESDGVTSQEETALLEAFRKVA